MHRIDLSLINDRILGFIDFMGFMPVGSPFLQSLIFIFESAGWKAEHVPGGCGSKHTALGRQLSHAIRPQPHEYRSTALPEREALLLEHVSDDLDWS